MNGVIGGVRQLVLGEEEIGRGTENLRNSRGRWFNCRDYNGNEAVGELKLGILFTGRRTRVGRARELKELDGEECVKLHWLAILGRFMGKKAM